MMDLNFFLFSSLIFISLADTSLDQTNRFILSNQHQFLSELVSSAARDSNGVNISRASPSADSSRDKSDCEKEFDALSDAMFKYSQCIVDHSLYSTVCSSCITQYNEARLAYQTDFVNAYDDFGQRCSERMILSAGMQMKEQAKIFVESTWTNLHCKGCFANESSGELLPEYRDFFDAFKDLANCILDSTQDRVYIQVFAPLNKTSANNTVCLYCGDLWYKNLGDIYAKFDANETNHVCQDIGDVMNYTRFVWRDIFECKSKPGDNAVLWVVSAFLAVLPMTFYIATYLNGSDTAKKRLQQKRLREYSSIQDFSTYNE